MNRNRRLLALAVLLITLMVGLVSLAKYAVKRAYPLEHEEIIKEFSKEYNIDPYLVAALIRAESNYDKNAISHKSANGLMQITGETSQWIADQMKISNFQQSMLYDPEVNIKMGCWYLNNLRKEFGSDELMLAAYNAGRGNVEQWLKNEKYSKDGKTLTNIPFKETDQYIKKIKTNYNIYKFIYGKQLSN
ncbi:lytic transglycosylase domain-containing protein [Clostridium sp. 19966]|uniref:lytic transglycosylase domain-containing protein n=1 Tax=Clostridium sp. 19966 TaxID=2768166 RepID=UPI0028DF236A|nr:lytic transglycosylase domain-containing protein [Clostridium sp. 19966]MDT8715263.1 lytic transglycosylase domain-containing protein [Clostridium sp. 19966]